MKPLSYCQSSLYNMVSKHLLIMLVYCFNNYWHFLCSFNTNVVHTVLTWNILNQISLIAYYLQEIALYSCFMQISVLFVKGSNQFLSLLLLQSLQAMVTNSMNLRLMMMITHYGIDSQLVLFLH